MMSRRTCAAVLAAAVVISAVSGGCASKPGGRATATPASSPTSTTSTDLYRAGRFAEARARAEVEHRTSDGLARRRAALTAGLSCHAMGRKAEARAWLEPLTGDADPQIGGRAAATLGIMALDAGENARAVTLLSQAAKQLSGDDAARAALRAGHAQAAIGQIGEASSSYQSALAAAESPRLKEAIQPYTQPGPFTLQLGVFSSKANADRKAAELRAQAAGAGLGSPSVAPARGKPGYSVRVGRFSSRHAATLAEGKLGPGVQAVVVPLD